MPDDPRPLRSGRYYTEADLAAAALAAVHRVVGHGKPYPTRKALADALGVTGPALSAAVALGDPARKPTAAKVYDRGASLRRLILRRLPPGFVVGEASAWTVEPDGSDVLPDLRS